MTFLFFLIRLYVDDHVWPKRVVQSKLSVVVWYRYICVQCIHKNALIDGTTVKKKVMVLHFHSKLVPNEIHLWTLHTRTYTETTWPNKGVFNSKDRSPPFPRHFPHGSNRPYQATQLLNHRRSLHADLCYHTTELTKGTIPRCCHRSDFYCVLFYDAVNDSKRPMMVYNCFNCCSWCNVITTTVNSFRRSNIHA
jgi:hypothetical protein